ncbi:MAG: hypothetical protein V4674_01310 [Patescibacteria group bacterium]
MKKLMFAVLFISVALASSAHGYTPIETVVAEETVTLLCYERLFHGLDLDRLRASSSKRLEGRLARIMEREQPRFEKFAERVSNRFVPLVKRVRADAEIAPADAEIAPALEFIERTNAVQKKIYLILFWQNLALKARARQLNVLIGEKERREKRRRERVQILGPSVLIRTE